MGKKVKEFKAGDFIFAKVKGYPAWPARVQRLNGKKYFIYFYGTGETANLAHNVIFDYAENKDKFLNKTIKRKDFNDGVKQIEYDFANNISIEEVLGGPVGDPVDTSTANVTDGTLDASSAADTTVNDTVNESNTSFTATLETAPGGDSDDGALVIDEGKKKKALPTGGKVSSTPKTVKALKTPKSKKDEAAPASTTAAATGDEEKEELVSRSGRKIRPKRYADEQTEENATLPSPIPKKRRTSGEKDTADKGKPAAQQGEKGKNYVAFTVSELEDIKEVSAVESDKESILIACLPSGQYVGVKLFQSVPTSFKNEDSKLNWYRQAASNALTLHGQLEKGHITAQSISAQLETDLNLTDEEKSNLDKEREIEEKKLRVQFLKTEMKLIELDAKIKSCLSLEKADTELCLKLIDELMELDIKALMLLKHPTCLETVKRMRAYVGNTPSWELSEDEALSFTKHAHAIRKQADRVYRQFKDLFTSPDGLSFWEYFSERVLQFKKCTHTLSPDELLEMVHEPKELSAPSAHTMRAAIDVANEKKDETPTKKRNTPAKKRAAAATPTKEPATKEPPTKVAKETPSKDKPKETPSKDKPKETPSKDKPKETPTKDKPKETTAKAIPKETPTKATPKRQPPRNRSEKKVEDNKQTEDDKKAEADKKAEEKQKAEEKADKKAEEKKAEEKKAEEKKAEDKKVDDSDSKSENGQVSAGAGKDDDFNNAVENFEKGPDKDTEKKPTKKQEKANKSKAAANKKKEAKKEAANKKDSENKDSEIKNSEKQILENNSENQSSEKVLENEVSEKVSDTKDSENVSEKTDSESKDSESKKVVESNVEEDKSEEMSTKDADLETAKPIEEKMDVDETKTDEVKEVVEQNGAEDTAAVDSADKDNKDTDSAVAEKDDEPKAKRPRECNKKAEPCTPKTPTKRKSRS